jgi:hypothetical protein
MTYIIKKIAVHLNPRIPIRGRGRLLAKLGAARRGRFFHLCSSSLAPSASGLKPPAFSLPRPSTLQPSPSSLKPQASNLLPEAFL